MIDIFDFYCFIAPFFCFLILYCNFEYSLFYFSLTLQSFLFPFLPLQSRYINLPALFLIFINNCLSINNKNYCLSYIIYVYNFWYISIFIWCFFLYIESLYEFKENLTYKIKE